MSILAPRNAQEAKFQYCNYGYAAKYKSREDCMANYEKDTQNAIELAKSLLASRDNTTIKDEPKPETILGNDLTNPQKWAWVIGLTLAAWGLIYWSQKQPNK